MISIEEAARVLREHAEEILCEVRSAPEAFPVMAEVDSEGKWCGAKHVYPDYTIYHQYQVLFAPNEKGEIEDVVAAIDNWESDQLYRLEQEQVARDLLHCAIDRLDESHLSGTNKEKEALHSFLETVDFDGDGPEVVDVAAAWIVAERALLWLRRNYPVEKEEKGG